MRTGIILTAATLLAAPLALAQTAETPPAPPPPAPPQIEVTPLPEPKGFESRTEIQGGTRREAQEIRRAAREAARDAEREARDAEREARSAQREAHDQLYDLGDRIRERIDRVMVAHAAPPLPPLPPIPDLGAAMHARFKDVDKQLSPDDARRIVDGAIAFKGNKRLKVGNAVADGEDWAKVEVRTVDDSLVDTVRVNRKTGLIERAPPDQVGGKP
jgi:Spy/CpxP family protein refolding chaperone